MRILILGGDGMLGHQLLARLRRGHQARATLRRDAAAYAAWPMFDARSAYFGVDVRDPARLGQVLAEFQPEAVVNAVGIVKQRSEATEAIASIEVNSLLPHRLALACGAAGARLVHMSTDCVFSGARGNYSEHDTPDPYDLYGRTKLLGELSGPGCLTIRTSIIGRELSATTGLTEWLLSQRGRRVEGYTKAVFSGLTTLALSRVVGDIVERHPALEGLYHVASRPVSKYDLVRKLEQAYDAGIQIEPSDTVQIDRSLDGTRFTQATGLSIPGWDEMIAEMAADSTPYEMWRSPGGAASGG